MKIMPVKYGHHIELLLSKEIQYGKVSEKIWHQIGYVLSHDLNLQQQRQTSQKLGNQHMPQPSVLVRQMVIGRLVLQPVLSPFLALLFQSVLQSSPRPTKATDFPIQALKNLFPLTRLKFRSISPDSSPLSLTIARQIEGEKKNTAFSGVIPREMTIRIEGGQPPIFDIRLLGREAISFPSITKKKKKSLNLSKIPKIVSAEINLGALQIQLPVSFELQIKQQQLRPIYILADKDPYQMATGALQINARLSFLTTFDVFNSITTGMQGVQMGIVIDYGQKRMLGLMIHHAQIADARYEPRAADDLLVVHVHLEVASHDNTRPALTIIQTYDDEE